jgi:hypothetical protein
MLLMKKSKPPKPTTAEPADENRVRDLTREIERLKQEIDRHLAEINSRAPKPDKAS